MMSPNAVGVSNCPCMSTVNCMACLSELGLPPTLPAATWTFCWLMA